MKEYAHIVDNLIFILRFNPSDILSNINHRLETVSMCCLFKLHLRSVRSWHKKAIDKQPWYAGFYGEVTREAFVRNTASVNDISLNNILLWKTLSLISF